MAKQAMIDRLKCVENRTYRIIIIMNEYDLLWSTII